MSSYLNFYAKVRATVLCARPSLWFASKISTPAGSIFDQSLALKPVFPRPFRNEILVRCLACPFWVPLVEYNEADSPGADYFVKKRIDEIMRKDPEIDTIILGCTHYPLLMPKILSIYLQECV